MSGATGHTFLYNLIILFIVIVFAFLAGSLSYYKAFRINNSIVLSIEKYSGYNDKSLAEIDKSLSTFGYEQQKSPCKEEYDGMFLMEKSEKNFNYCIYISDKEPKAGSQYNYGVLTYMSLDLPIIEVIKLPIFAKTNQIYKFTNAKPIL